MIKTQSLREVISNHLLDKVCEGTLAAGEKLNIAFLARELDVSATPLREALFGLSEKGLVEFVPNKGFKLKPLSLIEALETYQIISCLDGLALSHSSTFSRSEIRHLRQLLDKIESDATNGKVSFQSLSDFENGLISKCPNTILVNMCKELRVTIFQYEQLVIKHIGGVKDAFNTHRKIVLLIEENDFEKASLLLSETWASCTPLLQKLLHSEP